MALGNQPLLDDGVGDGDFGAGESGVGVAPGGYPVERLVVGRVLVELGGVGVHRHFRVDVGGEGFVVHGDEFQGVFGLVAVLGHHHGHGVAYVADGVFGDGGVGDGLHVGIGDDPGAGDGVENAVGVGAGVDGQDAGGGFGGGGVDAAYAGVGMGTAEDGGVDHAREFDVVGVGGLAGDEARVFAAADAGAENSGSHGLNLPSARRRPART